jgi:FAD/FMN-containing dehydrogenase
MQTRAMTIRLDLELAPECLSGRAIPDRGAHRKFSGWLGLVAAIDALLADFDQGTDMTDTIAPGVTVITPDDPHYDDARRAWNLAFDQRPAAVALPTSVDEVVAAVEYAASRGLQVAPQSTGHNPLHHSLEDTVLLKTERMCAVTIDPERRVARVEAGALWQDVTAAAYEHGLIGLAGSSPDVGVAGYALGGGLSWLARDKGLATNHVVSIEAVLADGTVVRAAADENPDLFWAMRGGGGAFAVATAFEIELFPITEIYAGMLVYPWERAAEIMPAWRKWTETAPDQVTTSMRILQVPPLPDIPEPLRGRGLLVIDGAYNGPAEDAERVLEPLRQLGPEIDAFAMMPTSGLGQIHMDPPQPVPGISTTLMLSDIDDEALAALVEAAGHESGSPLLMVEVRHIGGALAREPEGAGALGRLDGEYLFFALGSPMAPEMEAPIRAHLPKVRAAVEAHASGRDYLNFVEHEIDTTRLFSEDAYRRLQAVKAQYDPQDRFQSNHPIPSR